MTRRNLDPRLLELLPPLAGLVPPAAMFDRWTYSAFSSRALRDHLNARRTDTLVVTGAETDVCVLASVLAAVDLGYRVVLVQDALCSHSDQTHTALIGVFNERFGSQIETIETETLLSQWNA